MPAAAGRVPMTRNATVAGGLRARSSAAVSSGGSGGPDRAPTPRRTRPSTSATAGPANLDAGVAPRLGVGRAFPRLADAQAGDEGDAAVADQRLAVIAHQPGQRPGDPRRVEGPHLDPAVAQPVPEPPAGGVQRAEPVVDEPHLHAGLGAGDQRVGEPLARRVVVEDVDLEVDEALGGGDGVEPRRVVLRGVLQQPHGVALDQRRAGGARQRLVGDDAAWRAGPACADDSTVSRRLLLRQAVDRAESPDERAAVDADHPPSGQRALQPAPAPRGRARDRRRSARAARR